MKVCLFIIFLEYFSPEEAVANSLVGNGCYYGEYEIKKDEQTMCCVFWFPEAWLCNSSFAL